MPALLGPYENRLPVRVRRCRGLSTRGSWTTRTSESLKLLEDPELPAELDPYKSESLTDGDDRSLLVLRQRYQEAIGPDSAAEDVYDASLNYVAVDLQVSDVAADSSPLMYSASTPFSPRAEARLCSNSVVLPMPFGPTKATRSPRSTRKENGRRH